MIYIINLFQCLLCNIRLLAFNPFIFPFHYQNTFYLHDIYILLYLIILYINLISFKISRFQTNFFMCLIIITKLSLISKNLQIIL